MHFRSEDFPVEESPSAIWAVGVFVKNIFKEHLNFAHLQIANVTSAGPRGELQCGGGCRGWELVELVRWWFNKKIYLKIFEVKWGCGNRQSQGSDPLQLARKRWPYEMLGSSHQDEFFYSQSFTKSHYLMKTPCFSPVKPMKVFTHGFTDSVDPEKSSNNHAHFVNGELFRYWLWMFLSLHYWSIVSDSCAS